MNHLIIGYGEIGQAIHTLIDASADNIDVHDPRAEIVFDNHHQIDVMHVCFPYSKNFVAELSEYINIQLPDHIIIYSTLPIGITRGFPKAVHSPIEGKHPELEMSVRQMERWIGCNDKDEGFFFVNLFEDLGLRTRLIENTDWTEALKLLSTTEYGVNIEFARYKKHVADEIGMDYELTKDFNVEYNKLYKDLGMEKRFQKFVLDAPEGAKGGHCVTPNARILNEQYPDELVKIVGEL